MLKDNTDFLVWNLRDIINSLIEKYSEINQIFLFGSRAYRTESYRSDIDLLAICKEPIAIADINSWLHDEYPPVDLFLSTDSITAYSVVNGSKIFYRSDNKKGFKDLIDQIDAISLWDLKDGFNNSFDLWEMRTLIGTEFIMSVIPKNAIRDDVYIFDLFLKDLEYSGIKPFFSGYNHKQITNSILDIIECGLTIPTEYSKKAKNFTFDKIKLKDEYDFQNFIHFLLRPIYKDIQTENVAIKLDGQEKRADLGLYNNKIIIETKWIDNKSKKSEVIKTLDGLANFYSENPNVRSIIFLVLYKKGFKLDEKLLEYRFSYEKKDPMIIVRFFENVFD